MKSPYTIGKFLDIICPCEECPSYAICKYINPIDCSILYDFLGCKVNENARVKFPYRLASVNRHYQKEFHHSYIAGGKRLIYWKPIRML